MEMTKKEEKFLEDMKKFITETADAEDGKKPSKDAIKKKLLESDSADAGEVELFLDKVFTAKEKIVKKEKHAQPVESEGSIADGENEIGGKTYNELDELKVMAEKVIKEKCLNLQGARVRFLMVYPGISKTVLGRCQRSGALVKLFGGCDYVISFSGEAFDAMPVDVQELIMWHELLHIEPTMNKKGDIKFQIRDHNVKDFRCIIEAKGIDWVEDIYKGVTSTLGENENVNLESIKW